MGKFACSRTHFYKTEPNVGELILPEIDKKSLQIDFTRSQKKDKKQTKQKKFLNYTHSFISSTFISNARLKLTENQVNVKQHTETEPLLVEY